MPDNYTFASPTLIGPGSFYVTGEDNLRVVIWNSLTSAVVTIEGRFLTLAGAVTPFVQTIAPAADRSAGTSDFRLGDGWILNVSARVSSGDPQVGQVYVQLLVIRGLGSAPINIGTLAQGYATNADDLAWPGSPIRVSVDGPGQVRSVTVPISGGGPEISVTVPTGARWRLMAFHARLTTGAAVANREVQLQITDGTTELALVPSGVNQAASLVRRYSYFHAAPRGAGATATAIIAPVPAVLLSAGYTIATSTVNADLDDAYAEARVLVEEWIEG